MSAAPVTAPEEQVLDQTKPTELAAETKPADETAPAATTTPTTAAEENKEVKPSEEAAAATATDKPAETANEVKSAEPLTSGVLGYKAPGLVHQFKFSKRYIWLGSEPISTQHLSHYLRGTEAKTAHPVAAWSSQTGKGLLYLVRSEADKAHPQDVFNLADVTDLTKAAPTEFTFKLHGEKHAFKTTTDAERDAWLASIEKGIAEAKEVKESVVKSDGYQEAIKGLGKPAALAGGVAAGGAAAAAAVGASKKSEDKPEENKEQTADPARANSSGSLSSSDAEKATNKEKKSRSASRGKRASIFGALLGKKEEHEAKKEVKEEKKEEAKAEDAPAAEAAAATAPVAAAAETKSEDKAAEAPAAETPAAAAAAAPADTKAEEKKGDNSSIPKALKRNSIFGSIYQKVKSPGTEKKEADVVPAPVLPPKDDVVKAEPVAAAPETTTETPAVAKTEEAPETAAVPAATAPATAEKKTEKAETPKKDKESFLGGLLSKARAKSPAAGKRDAKDAEKASAPAVPPKDDKVDEAKPAAAAATEAPASSSTPAATATDAAETKPVDSTAATPDVGKTEETAAPASPETNATTPKDSRRKSLFASFSGKKEGETNGEKPSGGLGAIFRKPSQAIRNFPSSEKKDVKKENAVPEKAAEEKPAETTTDAAPAAKTAETEAETPKTIGDVVPEAIETGTPQQANPTVSATA